MTWFSRFYIETNEEQMVVVTVIEELVEEEVKR